MSTYQLYFTDGTLQPIGQFVRWSGLTLIIRFNDIDTYSVTANLTPELLTLAVPPNRIVILRNVAPALGFAWEYFASGPIERPGDISWSAGSGDDADPGQMVMQFADDGLDIARRITYPSTTHDSEHQSSVVADILTTPGLPAETVAKDLVDRNVGPSALTARKVANLTIETDAGAGSNVTYWTRFDRLGDILRTVCAAGGGLGYRTRQVSGPSLEFQVYVPVDRSATIVYSRSLGNLQSLKLVETAPASTVAIVGGDGTGTSRTIVEVANSAAVTKWGRAEVFVSNSATDTATLTQAGNDQLTTDGEQTQLTTAATDSPGTVLGVDYNVGDIVGYEYAPGRTGKDVVTSVTITVGPDGVETVQPTIGTGSASSDTAQIKENQATRRRLGALERT
jgi:hypothetical protein